MTRLALLFVLLTSTLSHAQFSFVPVNVPGAVATQVRGVNNYGEIVGFYQPSTNCGSTLPFSSVEVPDCLTHGFKIVNGSRVKLMVPNSTSTAIMGVNDYGDLVGFYLKPEVNCPSGIHHGFLWLHTNVVKTLDYPGTVICGSNAPWTVPMGVNKAGTVAGTIWSPVNGQPSGGFVWRRGTFSVMDLGEPGHCYACSSVNGISNNGILVGTAWRTLEQIPMWTGWLKAGADEDFFMKVQDDTFPSAVNNATDIIGWGIYGAGFFAKHIELNEGTNDAKEVPPVFLNLFYPGAAGTFPFGLNDQRAVVGAYTDLATGRMHGFMAKPNF
jgi:hypothetical protein